jgi:hypothetical protein
MRDKLIARPLHAFVMLPVDIPINSLGTCRELKTVLFGKSLCEQPRDKVGIGLGFIYFRCVGW